MVTFLELLDHALFFVELGDVVLLDFVDHSVALLVEVDDVLARLEDLFTKLLLLLLKVLDFMPLIFKLLLIDLGLGVVFVDEFERHEDLGGIHGNFRVVIFAPNGESGSYFLVQRTSFS